VQVNSGGTFAIDPRDQKMCDVSPTGLAETQT
jgi:hypothetical protein